MISHVSAQSISGDLRELIHDKNEKKAASTERERWREATKGCSHSFQMAFLILRIRYGFNRPCFSIIINVNTLTRVILLGPRPFEFVFLISNP